VKRDREEQWHNHDDQLVEIKTLEHNKIAPRFYIQSLSLCAMPYAPFILHKFYLIKEGLYLAV
jgi:hypothetical protein